jgi:hypothetical protein
MVANSVACMTQTQSNGDFGDGLPHNDALNHKHQEKLANVGKSTFSRSIFGILCQFALSIAIFISFLWRSIRVSIYTLNSYYNSFLL